MDIQTASLTGVIRIILIIAAIYFLVRILGRLLMPVMRESNPGEQRRRRPGEDDRKEGEVRIEYTNKSKQKREKGDKGDGEYIDFEELD
jgi:hypothetical protein